MTKIIVAWLSGFLTAAAFMLVVKLPDQRPADEQQVRDYPAVATLAVCLATVDRQNKLLEEYAKMISPNGIIQYSALDAVKKAKENTSGD